MGDQRILVVSRRKGGTPAGDAASVYVGRAMPRMGLRGSPLGNPFPVSRGYDIELDPDDILGAYRRWLDRQLADPTSPQSAEIARLVEWCVRSGDTLAVECWCAPHRCHADVIRDVLLARLAP